MKKIPKIKLDIKLNSSGNEIKQRFGLMLLILSTMFFNLDGWAGAILFSVTFYIGAMRWLDIDSIKLHNDKDEQEQNQLESSAIIAIKNAQRQLFVFDKHGNLIDTK